MSRRVNTRRRGMVWTGSTLAGTFYSGAGLEVLPQDFMECDGTDYATWKVEVIS
jgi:hypothetical protein